MADDRAQQALGRTVLTSAHMTMMTPVSMHALTVAEAL